MSIAGNALMAYRHPEWITFHDGDDGDITDRRIDERVDELMADEYSPFKTENLAEALAEIDGHEIMGELFATGRNREAGEMLAGRIRAYWYHLAYRQAEDEIHASIAHGCKACRGRGCHWCDEP